VASNAFNASGDRFSVQTRVLLVCTNARHYNGRILLHGITIRCQAACDLVAARRCSVAVVLHITAEYLDATLLTALRMPVRMPQWHFTHQGWVFKLQLFRRGRKLCAARRYQPNDMFVQFGDLLDC
jgi:hypothetical protein